MIQLWTLVLFGKGNIKVFSMVFFSVNGCLTLCWGTYTFAFADCFVRKFDILKMSIFRIESTTAGSCYEGFFYNYCTSLSKNESLNLFLYCF